MIAVDFVAEGVIDKNTAIMRVEPAQLDQLLHPIIAEDSKGAISADGKSRLTLLTTGLPASPGAAVGKVVFTADEAAAKGKKEPVILVRAETVPDDIHGMEASKGIL